MKFYVANKKKEVDLGVLTLKKKKKFYDIWSEKNLKDNI